ncbi:uncharacterized protein LOC121394235 [Xenopus laevis]|uniref:Uncharacterized protein LOC121394235 n=1 Tax=Xenopus laevis TaxID=8355 RepID=A0A8J1KT95_XENLA|nr:uncharacterized protein LOC121394235 [Xenopus laevis]
MSYVEEILLETNLHSAKVYFILDCLNMVLTKNYFAFEDAFYWQTQGTSMGAAVAPSYANIFVNCLEKKLFLEKEPYCRYILKYFRFVDDILLIWTGSKADLISMIQEANLSHNTIKFTHECSEVELNFLDVTITINNGVIQTSLYRKSVDKKNLLHVKSFHNPKVKRAIPKGQFMRAKRISSSIEGYVEASNTLTGRFLEKGYRSECIKKAIKEVEPMSRDSLLTTKQNNKVEQRIAFVSTYSQNSDRLEKVIRKYWPLIQSDRQYGRLFADLPLFCYKRGRTLKDLLCPSDTRPKKTKFLGKPRFGTYPCLGCNCCSSIIKGNKINHPTKGYEINIKCHTTCNSTFVVYLLKCPCGMGYVGQTKREVKKRIQEHRGYIRNFKTGTQTDTQVSRHFFECNHNPMQLRWCVLDEIGMDIRGGDRQKKLLQAEGKWIRRLNTLTPNGLNDI